MLICGEEGATFRFYDNAAACAGDGLSVIVVGVIVISSVGRR